MITEKAYAKVNLSLLITGVRNDGYHLLDTVMQTVSLYDTVSVYKNDDNIINVICDNSELSGGNNICHKAAQLFFEETGIAGGITVEIIKRIPIAAGLGGGSADAAAVLRALNKLYGNPLSYEELCDVALILGADVPFCINGGCARVKGIGEELDIISRTLPIYLVLVKEGEKPSTGHMYREFDRKGGSFYKNNTAELMEERIVKNLENNNYSGFLDVVYNDFSALWDYSSVAKALINAGADKVSLSGSGPTVMGIFENKDRADKAAQILLQQYKNVYSVIAVGE